MGQNLTGLAVIRVISVARILRIRSISEVRCWASVLKGVLGVEPSGSSAMSTAQARGSAA
ncbi:MAG: hypothetical protein QOK02_2713 [Mycobacterium sp.]|jgi:hypothetical protein|nr:hypothetical protein [Mycobacterium sp.]